MLNFRFLSPPCRYAGYDPAKPSSKLRRELSFIKLCLTLVFFHLHAGMQVPLKMEPAKTTPATIYAMVSPLFLIRASWLFVALNFGSYFTFMLI